MRTLSITLKAHDWRIIRLFVVTAMLVVMSFNSISVANAQGTTITFAGQPLTGSASEMTSFVLGSLRPQVAAAGASALVDPGTLTAYVPQKNCFGVTDTLAGGYYLLRESIYRTDKTNGRYDAVMPNKANKEHGDWPPHLPLFNIQSSQALACDELKAEIAWRLMYKPDSAGTLAFKFKLNPQQMKEYSVMASGGGLGLFVASATPTTMTVNAETFESQGCYDCMAHTAAVTNTIGAGVYSPETVQWFGEATADAPGLIGMYVLPVPNDATKEWTVTIQLDADQFANGAQPMIAIWFGRFDMPK